MKDLHFNLLSPEYQIAYKKRVMTRLLFGTSCLVGMWSLIFCILLVVAIEYLSIQSNVIAYNVEKLEAIQALSEVKEFQTRMQHLNTMLKRLKAVQVQEKNDAFSIVALVASKVPSGIALDQLTFSPETGSVLLHGKADLRTTLLTFENKLRTEPRFLHIEAPVENLTKATNAEFHFTLTLESQPQEE